MHKTLDAGITVTCCEDPTCTASLAQGQNSHYRLLFSLRIPSRSTPLTVTGLATGLTSQGRRDSRTPPWPYKTSQSARIICLCEKGRGVKQPPNGSRSNPRWCNNRSGIKSHAYLPLLHSLRHGWGHLAHNNTLPRVGGRSGRTNEASGAASQA